MNERIYVWDLLVRLFHWTLVLTFTIAYFTGDEDSTLHIYAGYIILGLIGFRLVWGFIGSQYARFGSFAFSPSSVLNYLGSLFSKNAAKHYIGHNPAGSWMVIILLISLTLTGVSGLKLNDEEEDKALAQQTHSTGFRLINIAKADEERENEFRLETDENENKSRMESDENNPTLGKEESEKYEGNSSEDESEKLWEEIHEFFANFTVLLVFLHISGVVLSSRKHDENLVRAMITGYKSK